MCSEPAELPCPQSCCAWSLSKGPDPQAQRWVPQLFNICGNVINHPFLAFAKESDPQTKPSLWAGREGEEASPGTLLPHYNLAESKNRKH